MRIHPFTAKIQTAVKNCFIRESSSLFNSRFKQELDYSRPGRLQSACKFLLPPRSSKRKR